MNKLLKPAAIPLRLPDGKTVQVLHPNPGDAISINNEPKMDILGYAHTPDGTTLYVAGTTPKVYRVHNEYEPGESREYFLKKLPATITEFCLPQVQKEITFHPAKHEPFMCVSRANPERTLPIVHGESTKNAA